MNRENVHLSLGEALGAALAASTSPAAQRALRLILGSPARDLFEVRTWHPSRLMFGFAGEVWPEAHRSLYVLARGQTYVERRSSTGRCLQPGCMAAGRIIGVFPGGDTRAWPPRDDFYARAITEVTAAVLPWNRMSELERLLPELTATWAFLDRAQRVETNFVAHLRRLPPFERLSGERIAALLNTSTPVVRTNSELGGSAALITAQGPIPDGFHVLLDGAATEQRVEAGRNVYAASVPVGGVLGLEPFVARASALESSTCSAPSLLARISIESYARFLSESPSARRALRGPTPPCTRDIVLLEGGPPGTPLAALTQVLARVIAADHQDRVAVFHLRRAGVPGAALPVEPNVVHLAVSAADPAGVCDALAIAFDQLADTRGLDIAFLAPEEPAPGWLAAAAGLLSRTALLAERPDVSARAPFDSGRVERVALLQPIGQGASGIWPTGTVRLRIDMEHVRSVAADPDADLGDVACAGLRRWGRALTDRLVGIAFGGGGSPGFAHVAVLRALAEHAPHVPIDMVAGTSFGALVGAWYVGERQLGRTRGPVLESLLAAGRKLNRCLSVGALTTAPLSRFIDHEFQDLGLGDLEIPFFPVSSEVESGTAYVSRGISLGQAVQVSGAFPPAFPPVLRGAHARLVDGGFVNNVPASVLRMEGAGFVIASNSIGIIPARTGRDRVRLRDRVRAALDPVERISDGVRAAMILFHRIGDSQTGVADATFESSYTGWEFWDFNRGKEVIDRTRSDADAFATHVGERFRVEHSAALRAIDVGPVA